MFTKLVLMNWKNFSGIDVDLTGRMFLVGPNASGKSNLLDVFRFLFDISKIGGGFQKAVNDRGGVSKIRSLSARRYPDIVVDVSMLIAKDLWRYRIAFSQDNNRNPILKEEKIWRNEEILLQRPTEQDKQDPVRMTQTDLEQIAANRVFRDVATFFSSIQYLHIVPQLVREPERSVGRVSDPYGGDFLEQLARVTQRTRDSRLNFIRKALKAALPQLKSLEFVRDEKNASPHLRGLYEHWRKDAGWQTEEQFSDGTLRLMGLLWSILDGQGPLLLEEPELSLHVGVVRHVPQVLARAQNRKSRQIMVSTHSRDMLSDPDVRPDEILMLQPSKEGTSVILGKDDRELNVILDSGGTIADAVIPRTSPQNSNQIVMALFSEEA